MKFDIRRRLSQYRPVTLQSLHALLSAFLAFHNAIASLGMMRCFGQMRLEGTERLPLHLFFRDSARTQDGALEKTAR